MLGQRLAAYYSRFENVQLLCSSFEPESFVKDIDYKQLDITDRASVKSVIMDFFPDIIINAAAFTAVDKCETEKELAWNINVKGVENLAHYAFPIDSYLVHISSDYVFDGLSGPYTEVDKVNPVSYYGRTKLASENALKSSGVRHSAVRTNVLYGPTLHGRPDFVKWVVNSLVTGQGIKIVTDQYNNPTYIDDLVWGIAKLCSYKKEGIYNLAGKEVISRLEFTERIAEYFDLNKELISPIKTEELNQPARRPLKSGLITLKAQSEFGYRPMSLEESFELILPILNL